MLGARMSYEKRQYQRCSMGSKVRNSPVGFRETSLLVANPFFQERPTGLGASEVVKNEAEVIELSDSGLIYSPHYSFWGQEKC